MSFLKYIREEIKLVKERDPAIKSSWEVFLYPGFRAVLGYQFAHRLYLKKHYFLSRLISQRTSHKTGIEIHPGATIGKRLFIDHGNGVVIGETAIIGNDVTLYQGVTLGGTGKETGKRHPTIGNKVIISTGAKVIGSFTIGDNSRIGAGSVVLAEVPPNSTVVGVPGRVVKRDNIRVPQKELNEAHDSYSVLDDISMLKEENQYLRFRLDELEKKLENNSKLDRQVELDNDMELCRDLFRFYEEKSKAAC